MAHKQSHKKEKAVMHCPAEFHCIWAPAKLQSLSTQTLVIWKLAPKSLVPLSQTILMMQLGATAWQDSFEECRKCLLALENIKIQIFVSFSPLMFQDKSKIKSNPSVGYFCFIPPQVHFYLHIKQHFLSVSLSTLNRRCK